MGGQYRIYGLMAGITIGFAIWGSAGRMPIPENREITAIQGETAKQESGAVPDKTAKRKATAIQDKAAKQTGAQVWGESAEDASVKAASGKETFTLHAQSAVLMDGDTGRVLYEKNGSQFRPMASTTKIMTCILALEHGSGEEICTVSSQASAQPKVHLGAPEGARFYLKDLLYSLMLESHNDSAVMIAEQIGGSVDGFADMMNRKARDIGCTDTCFLTPNGLDAAVTEEDGTVRTHGTTARDLAAIMRYCVTQSPKKEEFLKVTGTSNYSFSDLDGKRSYSCVNHNALLQMMEGALSGKTGFTGGAGYSYVGALESEGRTYILALLGCGWPPHKTYKWEDARKLFSYGKETYHYYTIREEEQKIPVLVTDGIAGDWEKQAARGQLFFYAPAQLLAQEQVPEKEREFQVLMTGQEKPERKVELPAQLAAPVEQGEQIGCVTYSLDDVVLKTFPLYADHSVEKKGVSHCLEQIRALFFLPSE